jgi:hypothetical protein
VNGAAHKTSIKADSSNAARLLLVRLYGHGNVSGVVVASGDLREAGAGQSLDAEQQQVKALADQARRLAQQKRQLQARQGMARA